MMDIEEFHKYRRLVSNGHITNDALRCARCENQYTIRLNLKDDEPYLQCTWCNTTVKPGLNKYEKILATNKEFYVDSDD